MGITRSASAEGKAAATVSSDVAPSSEITTLAAASSDATSSSLAGFTASTDKSARSPISAFDTASPPSSPASAAARPDPLSENSISSNSPFHPRAMAAAMLPDPTKPTIMSWSLAAALAGGADARTG